MMAVIDDLAQRNGGSWAAVYNLTVGDVMKHIRVANAKSDLQETLTQQAIAESRARR